MKKSYTIRILLATVSMLFGLLLFQSCQKDKTGQSSVPVSFHTAMTRVASMTELESFTVTAFLDDASSTYFMKEQNVALVGGDWKYNPVKYWPHEGAVHFMAYSTSLETNRMSTPTFEKVGGVFHATFDYTLPNPDETANENAKYQPDIVFSFQTGRTKDDGKVKFNFSHALTAIQFKVGTVPANTTLERIEFMNIRNSATCTVTGTSDADISYSWTVSPEASKLNYKQKFDSMPIFEGDIISDIEDPTTFMMIPQTFDELVHMRITVSVDGVEQIRQIRLMDHHTSWLPGEIHTYTISLE